MRQPTRLLFSGLALWVVAVLVRAEAPPTHLGTATRLVAGLELSSTSYAHGQGSVTFDGKVASHTDCSGLIDHLFAHDYGYDAEVYKRWLGSRRPTAARYHAAIVAGSGFRRIDTVEAIRPGDLLAIKYLVRTDNTGHIMIAAGAPQRIDSRPPIVDGTTQYTVEVIDSSQTGHGPTDTRYKGGAGGKDHDGLGRGVFRLYVGDGGKIAGFSWSTFKGSEFKTPDAEHLVVGRLEAGFRP